MSESDNVTSSLHHSVNQEMKCEKVDYSETEIKVEDGMSRAVKYEGFLCTFCGEHFFYEEYFTEHIQNHHSSPTEISKVQAGNANITEGMSEQDANQIEDNVVDDILTEDENCGTSFENAASYNNKGEESAPNVAINDGYTTDQRKKQKPRVQKSKKHSGEKTFKCNVCSFATANKSDLVLHTRIHTG